MSKHTPGPWFVRDFRESYMRELGWTGPSIDRILITNKTGAEIEASAGADCVVARIQFDNRTEPLGEGSLADALLIAAAPDMYAALQQIIDMNVQYAKDKYGDASQAESMACVTTARAALVKADPTQ